MKTRKPVKGEAKKAAAQVQLGYKGTPERLKKFLEALADGQTRGAACAVAGISPDSLARYTAASADFAASVKNAEYEAEAMFASRIKKAAHPQTVITTKTITRVDGSIETTETQNTEYHWQAAAWWLERRRHETYGLKATIVVQVQRAIAELLEFVQTEEPALYEQLSTVLERGSQAPQNHNA
jgi:hypothetical protein